MQLYYANSTNAILRLRPFAPSGPSLCLYRSVTLLSQTIFIVLLTVDLLSALPPLGLTEIDSDPGALIPLSGLSVFDDTAYVSTQEGIWTVTTAEGVDLVAVSHPQLDGALTSVTRLVESPGGDRYFAANFTTLDAPSVDLIGAGLFSLEQPGAPIVTWNTTENDQRVPRIVGLDETLRGAGTLRNPFDDGAVTVPAEFFPDGSFQQLALDDPLPGEVLTGGVGSVSESGFAVGAAQPSGTFGTVGAVWSPEGELSYLRDADGFGNTSEAFSVRDRNDGVGFNIGMAFGTELKYGQLPVIRVRAEEADIDTFQSQVIVSQSDFAAINAEGTGVFGYYPGLVANESLSALPIEQVFPELDGIEFDFVSDLYATSDGHIFMTLSGPDGLYLFGARDPSVIPEPSTLMLGILTVLFAMASGHSRMAKRNS